MSHFFLLFSHIGCCKFLSYPDVFYRLKSLLFSPYPNIFRIAARRTFFLSSRYFLQIFKMYYFYIFSQRLILMHNFSLSRCCFWKGVQANEVFFLIVENCHFNGHSIQNNSCFKPPLSIVMTLVAGVWMLLLQILPCGPTSYDLFSLFAIFLGSFKATLVFFIGHKSLVRAHIAFPVFHL